MLDTTFNTWIKDHEDLVEEVGILKVEIIYQAGRLAERESVLEMIASGILTHTPTN